MRVLRAPGHHLARGAAAALLLLGAACAAGEPTVEGLATGISRDSTMTLLGGPAAADSATSHIVSRGRYLNEGVQYEVLYYAPGAAPGTPTTALQRDDALPIVLANDAVAGWGWEYFQRLSATTKIQPPEFRAE